MSSHLAPPLALPLAPPPHTQEDSLSSLRADSRADSTGAVELCHFKYQQANGSASARGSYNGIQIQEQI